MRMKAIYSISLLAAAMVLLVISVGVQAASTTDDRIESSAKESYVFKTYLKGDDIKIQSKDGAVTLTGTVSEESHKSLAQETVAGVEIEDVPMGVALTENRDEAEHIPLEAEALAVTVDQGFTGDLGGRGP